jgi:V/A-type H+-transporting ATPase subunit D
MVNGLAQNTVSRSAFLELSEEERLVRSGYELLDEKRVQLAAEMLRQKQAYREARARFVAASDKAAAALLDAAASEGLDALQVHPPSSLNAVRLETAEQRFVGLSLIRAGISGDNGSGHLPGSPVVVRKCVEAFRAVLEAGIPLAETSANLERLMHDYERTERRVRALENVILPEIREALVVMEEHLELNEQEEIVRVRSLKG